YRVADEMRSTNTPVLVSVKWPTAPVAKEERDEQPLRLIRERQLAPTTPATLAKAGATFALVSGSGKSGDFLPDIRKAIDNGLSADDALRAVTITPAGLHGGDRQLASLHKGSSASRVITCKPTLD